MAPTVSVIIPALRWDHHLEAALQSVAHQSDGSFDLEVVVALAHGSGPHPPGPDRTSGPRVVCVSNPCGSTPAGLNAAILAAHGQFIVRVDTRTALPDGYVRKALDELKDTAVGVVGGAQVVADRSVVGDAYGCAFNSFLLGQAQYRTSLVAGTADTVYLGCWRRATFSTVGLFDERLHLNQDNELSDRIQSTGLDVRYRPDMACTYTSGRSAAGLLRRQAQFGRWRVRQARFGQRGFGARQITAAAALVVIALAFVVGLVSWPIGVIVGLGSLYVCLAMLAGQRAAAVRRLTGPLPGPSLPARLLAPLLAAGLIVASAVGAATEVLRPGRAA